MSEPQISILVFRMRDGLSWDERIGMCILIGKGVDKVKLFLSWEMECGCSHFFMGIQNWGLWKFGFTRASTFPWTRCNQTLECLGCEDSRGVLKHYTNQRLHQIHIIKCVNRAEKYVPIPNLFRQKLSDSS